MWAAIILGGWFLLSLAMGPWIGRFVASQSSARHDLVVPVDDPVEHQNPNDLAKLPTIRQA